jgi:hypothetical protein
MNMTTHHPHHHDSSGVQLRACDSRHHIIIITFKKNESNSVEFKQKKRGNFLYPHFGSKKACTP